MPESPRNVPSLPVNVALALAVVLVFVGVLELGLRLSGFSYVLRPQDIEFGKPDPVLLDVGFREDPDLYWVTKDYPEKLARYQAERPRLVFMGDSCTHLGRYDESLAAEVAVREPGMRLSWGNVGVAGWSSYQGRRQLARDVAPLAPAVVTIYYGWNDHWIGFGIEDKDVAAVKRGVTGSRLQQSRLVQLLTKTRVALRSRETSYPNRVSLVDFETNLRSMVEIARANDIAPMLITAATTHAEGAAPAVLEERWLRDAAELVPLHQAYVETVRRVAADTGAALCDAERAHKALPKGMQRAVMMQDGIHLTPEGDRWLGGVLADCLTRTELLVDVVVPVAG